MPQFLLHPFPLLFMVQQNHPLPQMLTFHFALRLPEDAGQAGQVAGSAESSLAVRTGFLTTVRVFDNVIVECLVLAIAAGIALSAAAANKLTVDAC